MSDAEHNRPNHDTYRVLQRAQRRIQGALADAMQRGNRQSIQNLTEERDTLSRIAAAVHMLTAGRLATLAVHPDDLTEDQSRLSAELPAILSRLVGASPTKSAVTDAAPSENSPIHSK